MTEQLDPIKCISCCSRKSQSLLGELLDFDKANPHTIFAMQRRFVVILNMQLTHTSLNSSGGVDVDL
jgi:hypothetical protein